jgi:hypothetical protein
MIKELEKLAEEARKYKSAEEFKKVFYDRQEENKMSIQGWNWDKPDGIIRYIAEFPIKKGAIKIEYEISIDKPVNKEEFRLSIFKRAGTGGRFLSNFDLKNINIDLEDYTDIKLFRGEEVIYLNLDSALSKVKEMIPQAEKKPFELFKIIKPIDFYNQVTKGRKKLTKLNSYDESYNSKLNDCF